MARGLRFSISASDRSKAAFSGVQNNLRRTQGLQRSWNAGLNSNRRAVQQFGFQMSDFAIQIAGGQSAMLAFTQQGGQMLQFFGPAGAIMAAFLAVFGSLIIAFQRSGKALSDLTPIMGVLGDDFRAIGRVLGSVKEIMIDFTNVVLNNMDRIIITIGVIVGIMAGRWVRSFIAARLATLTLAGALVTLRGALIRTGIGALIVGAGELVYQFTRLVRAAGGFGEAMVLLKDVALGVWEKIKAGAGVLLASLALTFNGIADAFHQNVISPISLSWGRLLDRMANTNIGEMMGLDLGNEDRMMAGLTETTSSLTDEFVRLSGGLSAAQAKLDAPIAGLEELRTVMAAADEEGRDIDIRDWFGGAGAADAAGGGGGGGNGGRGSVVDDVADQAKQIQDIFGDVGKSISSSLGTAFSALRDRTKSVKDVALDMLTSVFDKLTDTMLSPLWDQLGTAAAGFLIGTPGASGFSGGLLSGVFSSLFGGVPSRAGGGSTGKGSRSGGLDGRGGFLMMGHPNETMLDHTRHQGGGSQAPVVEVHVHENASDGDTQVKQSSGRIDVFLRRMVTETIADGGADKAIGGRFGIRPQPM